MGDIITFYSFKQFTDYVTQVAGVSQYMEGGGTNPHWQEIYETIAAETKFNYKWVQGKHVFDEAYYEDLSGDIVSSVGEAKSVSSASASSSIGAAASASNNVGGGGVKTAPVVKNIITDSTTGSTNIADPARGWKNLGVDLVKPLMNVVSGITTGFGLANLAINAQNSHVWRDLINNVFDGDLTVEATVDEIKDILSTKFHTIVCLQDDKATVTVPKNIADKLYTFVANHMVETAGSDTAELYIPAYLFSLCVFAQMERVSLTYDYRRYFYIPNTTAPNTGVVYFDILNISDDLFKLWAEQTIAYIIGCGYSISSADIETYINSFNGMMTKVNALTQDSLENCNRIMFRVRVYRGSVAPTKETPLSLNEIRYECTLMQDQRLIVDESITDRKRVECYQNVGSATTSGSECKYLIRGYDGTEDFHYGYKFKVPASSGSVRGRYLRFYGQTDSEGVAQLQLADDNVNKDLDTATLEFEQRDTTFVNGFAIYDRKETVPDNESPYIAFSNMGYKGTGSNYEPDEYLSDAFVRRNDTDKTPKPNTTLDTRYPGWTDWMHTVYQVDRNGNRTETDLIAVNTPMGNDNAKRIMDHGTDPSSDPQAYRNNKSQNDNQKGNIPDDTPIDDINQEIKDSVDDYNESRTTPDSAPDPIPESEPNPQYPSQPPSEPEGDSGDSPVPADLPGMTASGMVSVYNPTKEQVKNFSAWLWTDNVIENLKKILVNPIDAIIGMHIMYATPVTGNPENIICGYLDSGVAAKVVTQQYIDVDCGHISVPEYYGNATDYEPYTSIHIYLPFVGIMTLKANDVVGRDLYVSYGVDVLTGTVLARLTVKKGSSEICCYQFPGNCAVQIPLTGGDYANVIRSIASMATGVVASVATANPLPAIGGIIGGAMSASLDVNRSGSLGANAGVMGIRKPYLIITRRVAYDAARYAEFYGFPANMTVILGSCKGYTRVKSVHIDSIPVATDTEKSEIETLLKQGVIIK